MTEQKEKSYQKRIEEILDELYKKISDNRENPDLWYEDMKKVVDMFLCGDKLKEFRQLLEQIGKNRSDKENKGMNKVSWLAGKLRFHEPDFLLEKLKRRGRGIAGSYPDLKDALGKEMFRILEQVRLGKRADAIQMVLRCFVANSRLVPSELIDVMREEYSTNQFQAFMYAFLYNFIEEKGEAKNVE